MGVCGLLAATRSRELFSLLGSVLLAHGPVLSEPFVIPVLTVSCD